MKRTPSSSITPEKAAHIRYLIEKRGLYQHQVAALMQVNQGRISEIIRGKRYPNVAAECGPFPV